MESLKALFQTWVANGMFGRLTDVYKTVAYTAREGERVHTSGSPVITIPTTYRADGEPGTDRPPYDLSLIEVQDGATRKTWLYDRSAWVDLQALTLASDCPLAERGIQGLSACVADEILSYVDRELPESAKRSAFRFRHALSYKLGSDRPARVAEFY